MARERPVVVLVMAILNMVFGAIGLFCGLCSLVGVLSLSLIGNIAMPGPQGSNVNPIKDMQEFINREVPAYQFIEISRAGLIFILAVVLIVSGIGLLLMKSYGRWLAIVFAVLIIPVSIGYAIFQIGFVQPATDRWQQQFLLKQGAGAAQVNSPFNSALVGAVQTVVLNSIPCVYAVVLIVVMMMPSVVSALAGSRRRRGHFADEEEEEAAVRRPTIRRSEDEDEWRFRKRRRDED